MGLYARILRVPHVAVLILATTLSRLPFAINALALLLFLREETGSFAVAGAATGALALGGGLAGPFVARLVDRRGARLLLPLAFLYAAAILAIWGLGAEAFTWLMTSLVAGLSAGAAAAGTIVEHEGWEAAVLAGAAVAAAGALLALVRRRALRPALAVT